MRVQNWFKESAKFGHHALAAKQVLNFTLVLELTLSYLSVTIVGVIIVVIVVIKIFIETQHQRLK